MPGPPVSVAAPPPPEVVAAAQRVIDAAAAADGHADLDPAWATAPGVAVVRVGPPARPGAVAIVTPATGGWSVDVATPPDHRGHTTALDALVTAALGHIAVSGGGTVHIWLSPSTAEIGDHLEAHGASRTRVIHELRCPLPLAETTDVPVRAFAPGADDEAWLAVNNRAFAWHPEQRGWAREDLARRLAEPWFDPDGFLIHERDGRIAAFCWTKEHADIEPPFGEIHVIGVDPDFQGLGLGRALTIAGLAHLARRGLTIGALWVEGDNERALQLYADLGFARHRTRRAVVIDVAAQPAEPAGRAGSTATS